MRQCCQEKAAVLGVSDAGCPAATILLLLRHHKYPQLSSGHGPPDHNPGIKTNQAGVDRALWEQFSGMCRGVLGESHG